MAYTDKEKENVFESIIKNIRQGESLRASLSIDGTPSSQTFYKWIEEDENKAKQYAHACEERQDALFEEILEIADENNADVYKDDEGNVKIDGNTVQRSRLKIDARKWVLSKMNPKKYGDKVENTITGGDKPIQLISLGNGINPDETTD